MTSTGLARPIYPPTIHLHTPALPTRPFPTPSGCPSAERPDSYITVSTSADLKKIPSYRSRPQVSSQAYQPLHSQDNGHRPASDSISQPSHDAAAALSSTYLVPQWSIPQAKAILTTWTILASLLASTSTSLLSFFRASHSTPPFVPALVYAAIGFEIWAAVVAAATMVAEISMQSVYMGRDTPTYQASQLSVKILDNLTLTCGCLVSLAAFLELTALVVYAYSLPQKQNGARDEAIAITLALLVGTVTTVAAIIGGCWNNGPFNTAGREAAKSTETQADREDQQWLQADGLTFVSIENAPLTHAHELRPSSKYRRYPISRHWSRRYPRPHTDKLTLCH